MNTFATLLLAFPFYLAIKGKLATYIALAKPDASSAVASTQNAAATPTANGMGMTGNPSTTSPAATVPSVADMTDVVSNVTHIFAQVADITALA